MTFKAEDFAARRRAWPIRFTAVLFACLTAWAQVAEIPYLTGRITDNAEILSRETRAHLAEIIKNYELASGNQIAILTLPSLQGTGIEEYAAQVLDAWKLGEKGKNNGVLLLVSPEDRHMRIEVGAGLKGTLSEESAARIVRDRIAPDCRNGDYNAGIDAGIQAIIAQLQGGEPAPAAARTEESSDSDSFFEGPDLSLTERILIGAFVFGIIGLFTVFGIVTPGAGWFLYLFLIPFWAMFPIVVVGSHGALIMLITYLAGFPLIKLGLRQHDWYRKALEDLKTKGVAHIGGFVVRSGKGQNSWESS